MGEFGKELREESQKNINFSAFLYFFPILTHYALVQSRLMGNPTQLPNYKKTSELTE